MRPHSCPENSHIWQCLSFCAANTNHNALCTGRIVHNDNIRITSNCKASLCVSTNRLVCMLKGMMAFRPKPSVFVVVVALVSRKMRTLKPRQYSSGMYLISFEQAHSTQAYINIPERSRILLGSHKITGLCLFFGFKPPYIFTHGLYMYVGDCWHTHIPVPPTPLVS